MECQWCERKLNDYYIEMAWIDNIDYEDILIERYCSSQCIRKAIN